MPRYEETPSIESLYFPFWYYNTFEDTLPIDQQNLFWFM